MQRLPCYGRAIAPCTACRYDHCMTGDIGGDAFQARLADLIGAFRAVGREILATPDGRLAYQRANELWNVRRDQDALTAWLRAHGAARIAQAAHMSLGDLADELGLARPRAQQLEKAGRESHAAEFEPMAPAGSGGSPDAPEPQGVVAAVATSPAGGAAH